MAIYNAIDVANYMVNKSIDMNAPISNLKLQKLLYYVQASKLVETGTAMFEDKISVWRYGPVVESVYHKFKIYANLEIDERVTNRGVDFLEDLLTTTKYDPFDYISSDDQKIIDVVLLAYQEWNAMALVRKTHSELPWKNAYDNNDRYISLQEIEQFYKKNKTLILS